jgi:hypothetical protein
VRLPVVFVGGRLPVVLVGGVTGLSTPPGGNLVIGPVGNLVTGPVGPVVLVGGGCAFVRFIGVLSTPPGGSLMRLVNPGPPWLVLLLFDP